MEKIIHLPKTKNGYSMPFKTEIKVDQILLDDIIKILHFIETHNSVVATGRLDFGNELLMFYRSFLDPNSINNKSKIKFIEEKDNPNRIQREDLEEFLKS